MIVHQTTPRLPAPVTAAFLLCVAAGCGPVDEPTNDVTLQIADAAAYKEVVARHKGQVVLVDFWATWCAPCVEQFAHTIAMHNELQGQGLAVISVSLDEPESFESVRTFLQAKLATFDNLLSQYGGGPKAVEAFEIPGGAVPHYKLYDRNGELRYEFSVDPRAKKQFTPGDVRQSAEELLRGGT
jgi:thiol-disulfide isomerase/thioredoxin